MAQLSIEGRARPPRLQLSCVKELQAADTEKKKKKKKALQGLCNSLTWLFCDRTLKRVLMWKTLDASETSMGCVSARRNVKASSRPSGEWVQVARRLVVWVR